MSSISIRKVSPDESGLNSPALSKGYSKFFGSGFKLSKDESIANMKGQETPCLTKSGANLDLRNSEVDKSLQYKRKNKKGYEGVHSEKKYLHK